MKVLIKCLTVFLLVNAVAPSPMYYTYDDKPDAGYSVTVGTVASYKNRLNSHKKYFIGSNNQKYMKLVNERAVDSHFTVEKSPPKPLGVGEIEKHTDDTEITKNSHNSRRRANEDINNADYHENPSTRNDLDRYQDKEKTTLPDNQAHTPLQNQHNYNHREYLWTGDNVHDMKHNIVSVNAHKAAVSNDERVLVKIQSQQFIHQSQGYQQKVAGSGIKDKSLHKTAVINERNKQMTMPRTPELERGSSIATHMNGMAQADANTQRLDSKKRDTVNNPPNTQADVKAVAVQDKIRKYIHKDVNHKAVPSRIGNHEDIVDVEETPYALFYRTNSEHLDDQEVLIENPLAEPSNSAYSDKMAWNIENEAQDDSIKTKTKRAPNVKIHKKVKNHTSYRNR